VHSGSAKDVWKCPGVVRSLEVNLELSIVQGVSVEVTNKVRVLEVTRLFLVQDKVE